MRRLIIASLIVAWMPIKEAHAYLGPGLGLGALGVVLGLLVSVGLAVLALFWYPAKRVLRRSKMQDRETDTLSTNSRDGSDGAS